MYPEQTLINLLEVFGDRPILLGMLHVWPGMRKDQIKQALEDAERLEGFSGLIVENYDWGYADSNLATEEAARTLGQVLREVASRVTIPVGVNILPNDYRKALAVAKEYGGRFIQLDHVTGDFVNVESVDPGRFLSDRVLVPDIIVLGGIQPKYYRLRTQESIVTAANRAAKLADAVVVTGTRTGGHTKIEDLVQVRQTIGKHPVFVGSGLTAKNAREQLMVADGAIVGTALKQRGVRPGEPIARERVKLLLEAAKHQTH